MVVEVALLKDKMGAANGLRLVLLGLTLATSLVGCKTSLGGGAPGDAGPGGGPADAGEIAAETPCDPLAAKPIGLGAVIGVGTDSGGTLYVDAANGIFRCRPVRDIRAAEPHPAGGNRYRGRHPLARAHGSSCRGVVHLSALTVLSRSGL